MAHTYKYTPHILEADISPAGDNLTGKEWEVVIIGPDSPDSLIKEDAREFIRSKNGRLYDTGAVAMATAMFEGVKVYDDHLTEEEFQARGGMRSPAREWLGTIVDVAWDAASRQLKGIFKVVDQGLAGKLMSAFEAKVLKSVGLSLDAFTKQDETKVIDGVSYPVVTGFPKVNSVDLVGDPAAGGGFVRAIAANNEVNHMSDMNEMNLDGLAAELAEVKGLVSQLAQSLQPAAEAVTEEDETEEVEVEETEAAESEQAVEALKEVNRLRFEMKVDKAIEAAKLTGRFAELARKAITSEKDIEPVIKSAKEAQASTDPTGRVAESGQTRGSVSMGMNERDMAEIAFTRLLLGNSAWNALHQSDDEDVKARLSESYQAWVKGGRENITARRMSEWVYNLVGGDPFSNDRAYESVTQSSMSSIVKNALNLKLAADYSVRETWWDPIVRVEEVDTIDQATLVRTYGLNSLSVVNEGAAYTELAWADDEETASFVKKGNYIGVTLETLLNDKLGQIRTIPTRLANSWYNTLSDLVANVFLNNSGVGPTLADTGALFNATATTTAGGHANLLTTALAYSAYDAVYTAMGKQTDQQLGVGRRLNIAPRYLLGPVDLRGTALQIRNSEFVPATGNNASAVNIHNGTFDYIQVPQFTDTNNWATVADPMMHPAIWLIFLRGKRVPELYASESETAGAMFTNDELRFKVRMMTWRFSGSEDCAPVSDFRPLHKSNVA